MEIYTTPAATVQGSVVAIIQNITGERPYANFDYNYKPAVNK